MPTKSLALLSFSRADSLQLRLEHPNIIMAPSRAAMLTALVYLLVQPHAVFAQDDGVDLHSSPFRFPRCVDSCVDDSGCGRRRARCMCPAAQRGSFLGDVVSCIAQQCQTMLPTVDPNFLGPMEKGCAMFGMPIPDDKVDDAKKQASGLLPPISVTATPPGVPTISTASPKPTTTAKSPRPVSSDTEGPESTGTQSSTDRGLLPSTTDDRPPPTITSIPSATSTSSGRNTEPTDSSPFASPIGSAPARLAASVPWFLVVLPLGAFVLLR